MRPREYAFADDFNAPADCLADLRRLVAERMPGCPGLEEVDAMLAQLHRVRPGDLVSSRHYNMLVDALRKLKEVVELCVPPPPWPASGALGGALEAIVHVATPVPPPPPTPPAMAAAASAAGAALGETIIAGEVAHYAG